MNPGLAFAFAEAVPALAGAGIAILVSGIIHRHHERRIQHLEHEVGHMHAGLSTIPDKPDPSTPEVAKRYARMVA